MANFDARNVNLVNHPVQNSTMVQNSSPQGQQTSQVVPNQTQNLQQGVNLNV